MSDIIHDVLLEAKRTLGIGHPTARAAIAQAAQHINRQEDEITRLKGEVEDLRDPKLRHMRLENGCLDMALVSPVIEGLATALGGWFIAGGAKNYAEMRLHDRHETGAVYIVTVQKSGAKTPHDLRREAEAELATLRATNERLVERNIALSNELFRRGQLLDPLHDDEGAEHSPDCPVEQGPVYPGGYCTCEAGRKARAALAQPVESTTPEEK